MHTHAFLFGDCGRYSHKVLVQIVAHDDTARNMIVCMFLVVFGEADNASPKLPMASPNFPVASQACPSVDSQSESYQIHCLPLPPKRVAVVVPSLKITNSMASHCLPSVSQ